MFADLLGYHLPDFPGAAWIPPVLGTVIFFYGGWPFLTGGWARARSRRPGMMLLIAMAITVAFVASWVTTLGIGGFDLDFWWELALLIVIMLLGHWLEMRALGAASGALDALAALLPDTAEQVDRRRDVARSRSTELRAGDVVLVRSGARVPADGTVVDGRAEVDESMITGESRPVARSVGDTVVAGTVATDSALRVAGHRRRRRHRAGRHPAARRRGAGLLAPAPRRWPTGPRRCCSTSPSAPGVITFIVWSLLGNVDEAVDAHRHRAGDRLPARARPGHPAGDRHLHRRGPRGPACW